MTEPMRLEPITWAKLAVRLAAGIDAQVPADGGQRLRVALDGAPAARPHELAAPLAAELRTLGRPVAVVAVGGFLRPASLRLEGGREDPDAYYDSWYDAGALWREVLNPLQPGGSGELLPDLWDPVTDRATRSPRVPLPTGGVLLLHGPLLLGRWFPFDLTVHVSLSAAALARRTPEGERWTLPAFARYEREVRPLEAAEVTVRADDPRRPAWSGWVGRPRPGDGPGDSR